MGKPKSKLREYIEAIILAIVIALFRLKETVDLDLFKSLKH